MLQLRPVCEHCNKNLPPESSEAMICSYECTFCRSCVATLDNVCPNCGGDFVARPIRPKTNWKNNNNLEHHPATDRVILKPVDLQAHKLFADKIKPIAPRDR